MNYPTTPTDAEIDALAEYTLGRVCEADDSATTVANLHDVPLEAIQATLNERVEGLDELDQAHYDILFDRLHGAIQARLSD